MCASYVLLSRRRHFEDVNWKCHIDCAASSGISRSAARALSCAADGLLDETEVSDVARFSVVPVGMALVTFFDKVIAARPVRPTAFGSRRRNQDEARVLGPPKRRLKK